MVESVLVIKRSVIAVFSPRWQWGVLFAAVLAPIVWKWYGAIVSLVCLAVTAAHVIDVLNDHLVLSPSGASFLSRGVPIGRREVFVPLANIQAIEVSTGVEGLLGLGKIIIRHAEGVEVFSWAIHPERAKEYAKLVASNSPR